MNYKVLYRKYRPDKFSSMVGQEYTLEMLRNAILHHRISHAYLFTGPRGTGKTSTAKIFAKTINCLEPVDGEACGKCVNCIHFTESPDIIEIDAASNNGVDDIRELINNVKVAPSEGKYKVYIIDEVHMMTDSAFNALLLTLEEPPKHAVFIMATTNVENVPITILSRCQRFNFQKISLDNLKKQIMYVCDSENISISDDAVEEIAYLSEGGMRDALSLLDQLSSTGEKITVEKILSHYGSISFKFIKELISKIEENDVSSIINLFKDLQNSSSDYKIFLKKIIQEFTHLAVLIKLGSYHGKLTYKQLKEMIFEFNEIMNKVNINMNPYILIELVILNSFDGQKKDLVSEESSDLSISLEVNKLEKEVFDTSSQDNVESNSDIIEIKKIRINNCFVGAKKDFLVQYQEIWSHLCHDLTLKPELISLILDSSLVASSKEYCIISCKLESTANLFNSKLDEISDSLKSFFPCNVHFIALSDDEWQKEKMEYVKNLKNKYVYQLMEEKKRENNEENSMSEIENIATNIFSRDKIEIV